MRLLIVLLLLASPASAQLVSGGGSSGGEIPTSCVGRSPRSLVDAGGTAPVFCGPRAAGLSFLAYYDGVKIDLYEGGSILLHGQ